MPGEAIDDGRVNESPCIDTASRLLATHDPREEPRRPHREESSHRDNSDCCRDDKVRTAYETAAEAVSDREIKDDKVERARNQAG